MYKTVTAEIPIQYTFQPAELLLSPLSLKNGTFDTIHA